MSESIIIVGAGQAAMKAAETLRQKGYAGAITMIGDEPYAPYQRPPLSKAYLKGELDEERLFLKAPDYFGNENIDLKTGRRVESISPQEHCIRLDNGEALSYSKLLLATGTRARQLPIEGCYLKGVFTLRSIDDTQLIAAALKAANDVAIIGGGYIGMEFAAVARGYGKGVAVIETQERILKRSVAPEISSWFQYLHEKHGVQVLLNQKVDALTGDENVAAVALAAHEPVKADLVLIAAGAEPAIELAIEAGLKTGRGIIVDEACRTSAEDIFAAGDCTEFFSPSFARTITLESVQNASDQGRAAALSMLGEAVSYDPVPWFWSDQFDARLQIAGLSQGYDRTELEGDPQSGSFALNYFKQGELIAVDAINQPRAHMMARKKLAEIRSNPTEKLAKAG